jgi:hypothetical protein
MFKISCVVFLALFLISGCAGAPGSGKDDSQAKAEAAAAAALTGLDGALGYGPASQGAPQGGASQGVAAAEAAAAAQAASGAGANSSRGNSRPEPAWVSSPDSVFSRAAYAAAVGYGGDRTIAEKNAFANLTNLFGQIIQGEQTATTKYSEAVLNGAVDRWAENTDISNAIKTSAELESLVGAEIRDYWYDGKTSHYAVAVMERAKTAVLYGDMIRSNEKIIEKLTAMSGTEKNSLDGYSRYRLAGTIADANRVFANVLSVVGSSNQDLVTGIKPGDMKKGDDYRLEAANIAKNIPIAVEIGNDSSRRLQGAFASAVNKAGFRSGGSNSRYRIRGDISFSPVDLPNQKNKFVRYTLDASLIDTSTSDVLFPYTLSGREGHLTAAEAETRAVSAAERQINETYSALLTNYLSTLLPDKK